MSKSNVRIFDEKNKIYIDKSFSNYSHIQAQLPTSGNLGNPTGRTVQLSQQVTNEIERDLLPYFKDMHNLDAVFDEFSKNLTAFLHQTEEAAMLNLWSGNTVTGKTLLAKRLSGFEGFKAFSSKGIKTFYFDAFQVKDNFDELKKDFLDKSKFPNSSIVFIDEVEKILDISHKVVDEPFVKKFRKFIEDLNSARKLFIVFIAQPKAQRSDVLKLFDIKLTSIMDFDTQFPDWTKENLVHVLCESFAKRNYEIQDDAAAALATHCLQNGSIVEMIGVMKLLEVDLKHAGRTTVDIDLVNSVIKGRG